MKVEFFGGPWDGAIREMGEKPPANWYIPGHPAPGDGPHDVASAVPVPRYVYTLGVHATDLVAYLYQGVVTV